MLRSSAYVALLAARAAAALLAPGYVHPDEYFQGVEVAAGEWLSVASARAWEWAPPAGGGGGGVRSLASRAVSADVPLALLAAARAVAPEWVEPAMPRCVLCVCAWARARVRACVRAWVHSLSTCAFSALSHARADLGSRVRAHACP